jgi:hypothetical protein
MHYKMSMHYTMSHSRTFPTFSDVEINTKYMFEVTSQLESIGVESHLFIQNFKCW